MDFQIILLILLAFVAFALALISVIIDEQIKKISSLIDTLNDWANNHNYLTLRLLHDLDSSQQTFKPEITE